jgi:hypothetical protein
LTRLSQAHTDEALTPFVAQLASIRRTPGAEVGLNWELMSNRTSIIGSLGLVMALCFSSACGAPAEAGAVNDGRTESNEDAGRENDTGSVSFSLRVGPGVQLNKVDYTITKDTFVRTGSLDVSMSSTISGSIGGIPSGNGYSIALKATDPTERLLNCQGSSTFDVTAGVTVPVAVHMSCHELAPSVPFPPFAAAALAFLLQAAGVWALRHPRRRERTASA